MSQQHDIADYIKEYAAIEAEILRQRMRQEALLNRVIEMLMEESEPAAQPPAETGLLACSLCEIVGLTIEEYRSHMEKNIGECVMEGEFSKEELALISRALNFYADHPEYMADDRYEAECANSKELFIKIYKNHFMLH